MGPLSQFSPATIARYEEDATGEMNEIPDVKSEVKQE